MKGQGGCKGNEAATRDRRSRRLSTESQQRGKGKGVELVGAKAHGICSGRGWPGCYRDPAAVWVRRSSQLMEAVGQQQRQVGHPPIMFLCVPRVSVHSSLLQANAYAHWVPTHLCQGAGPRRVGRNQRRHHGVFPPHGLRLEAGRQAAESKQGRGRVSCRRKQVEYRATN